MSCHEVEDVRTREAVDAHRVSWFDPQRPVVGGTVFTRSGDEDDGGLRRDDA